MINRRDKKKHISTLHPIVLPTHQQVTRTTLVQLFIPKQFMQLFRDDSFNRSPGISHTCSNSRNNLNRVGWNVWKSTVTTTTHTHALKRNPFMVPIERILHVHRLRPSGTVRRLIREQPYFIRRKVLVVPHWHLIYYIYAYINCSQRHAPVFCSEFENKWENSLNI